MARMTKKLPDCIAIDGPAASGKTTVGSAIAKKYGYLFLDTGLMYRAVTFAGLRRKIPPVAGEVDRLLGELKLKVVADELGSRIYLAGEDVTPHLRDADVEANVSKYAAIPEIREAMVRQQRKVAKGGRAILAGRDIGTVVLPKAALKLYLDADEEARGAAAGDAGFAGD